jgi:hypothetical protein
MPEMGLWSVVQQLIYLSWVCICGDSFVQEGLLGGSQANRRGAWSLWRLTLKLGSREWGRR